jgi:glycosyltransferase involved in cell wall biosynthesis
MIVPLVSVCMQTWNSERFIAEAIESVLGQDFGDIELIIVDGASTDATRQIIERYAKQDPRIRAIFHERYLDISRKANDGIEAAKGKFIAQIDSDDVWLSDKLTKQLAVLERDEDLIVWSEGEIIDDAGRSIGKSFSERLANNVYISAKAKKSGNLWQDLLPLNYIFHSTIIYKKQNLGDVRYDEGILVIDDFKFFLDLARQYQFYYIAEPLAKYRIHGDNTLAGSGPEALKRRQIADKEYISIVEDAMRQYDDEITRETRAVVYGHIGLLYYLAGETKKGLRFFLRAFMCNPLEKRNVWYLRLAFKRMLRAVSSHA